MEHWWKHPGRGFLRWRGVYCHTPDRELASGLLRYRRQVAMYANLAASCSEDVLHRSHKLLWVECLDTVIGLWKLRYVS